MKRIVHRKTGLNLSLHEARTLAAQLKKMGVTCVEHRSVYGYTREELAEKANCNAVLETYEGYTFAFVGTENYSFEGFKFVAIAIKDLPSTFEESFPNFFVLGK